MIRPLFTPVELLRQHVQWLTRNAWELRFEIEVEKKRKGWHRRYCSPLYSKYRFIRLEIGWLRAIVGEDR